MTHRLLLKASLPRPGAKYTSREDLGNGKYRYHYGDEHPGNLGHPRRMINLTRRAGFESVHEAIEAHTAARDPNATPDPRLHHLHPDAIRHVEAHRPQTLDRSHPALQQWYDSIGVHDDAAPAPPKPPKVEDSAPPAEHQNDGHVQHGFAFSQVAGLLRKARGEGRMWRTDLPPTTRFAEYSRGGTFSHIKYVPLVRVKPTQNAIVDGKVDVIKRMLETEPEKIPPVVVERVPDANHFAVLDGHHRLEAARRLGRRVVPVSVYTGLYKAAGTVDDTLAKARKGEVVAGHKYRARNLKPDGTWEYIYGDPGALRALPRVAESAVSNQRRSLFQQKLQGHRQEVEKERQMSLLDFDALVDSQVKHDVFALPEPKPEPIVDYDGTSFGIAGTYDPSAHVQAQINGVPMVRGLADTTTFEQGLGLIEKSIRNMHYEIGHWIDGETGALIYSKKGTAKQVPMSFDETLRAGGAIFTHNHPSGGSFSDADIDSLLRSQGREMRAVGQKYRYVMRLPEQARIPGYVFNNGSKRGRNEAPEIMRLVKKMKLLHKRYEKQIGLEREQRIRSGVVTYREATEDFWHDVWTSVFRDMGWSECYKREPWEDGQATEWGGGGYDEGQKNIDLHADKMTKLDDYLDKIKQEHPDLGVEADTGAEHG